MQLALPVWFEIGTYVVLGLILAFDLILAFKRPHVPSTRESALWIGFYVLLALIFAGLMLVPYLAWITYAAALCRAIWRMNPELLG